MMKQYDKETLKRVKDRAENITNRFQYVEQDRKTLIQLAKVMMYSTPEDVASDLKAIRAYMKHSDWKED